MLCALIVLIFLGVIGADVNKTLYNRMPMLYRLDPFEKCLDESYGYYCVININVTSRDISPLMDYITKHSSNTKTHYRFDNVHRGLCLTDTCKHFLNFSEYLFLRENESMVSDVINRCINSELEKDYKLQGRAEVEYCNFKGQKRAVDGLDIGFAVIALMLVLLNIIGSIYDVYLTRAKVNGSKKKANPWLLAFSIQRNMRKLKNSDSDIGNSTKKDSRLAQMKGLQGIRFLSMVGVIFVHLVLLLAANYLDNPRIVEIMLKDPLMSMVYNGTLIMQTFLCMASFLAGYHFLIFMEKDEKFSFWVYPSGILRRWVRLTPVYALMLGFTVTWMHHLGHGPLWDHVVTAERDSCRTSWWTHLLYINNYKAMNMTCMFQTWYLAADIQLFCYSLAVMVLIWKYPKIAKLLFPILLFFATLIPIIITYIGEYDAIAVNTPETYRSWFNFERTFQNIYIPGHTNAAAATIGLWAAYVLYHIQKRKIDLVNSFWFRFSVYLSFPACLGLVLSGSVFYQDDYVYDRLGAAMYAGFSKTFFALGIANIIVAMCCGAAGIYGSILEWSLLQVPGKLTYCALFVHTIVQKTLIGTFMQPFYLLDYEVLNFHYSTVFITYIFALPLHLMVEAPATGLQKLII